MLRKYIIQIKNLVFLNMKFNYLYILITLLIMSSCNNSNESDSKIIERHKKEIMKQVDQSLGAIARPGTVYFVSMLPKTRSGKLLRRSIQAIAEGRDPGDLTTLDDLAAIEEITKVIKA